MKATSHQLLTVLSAVFTCLGGCASTASGENHSQVERAVNAAIRSVLEEHDVPGMVVALTVRGRRYFYGYGVASKETGRPVTEDTIFEIGSISKTLTATLASYAKTTGALSLADSASQHLPALAGSSLGKVSLLDLGTYTAGGLPLQFPDGVEDEQALIAYGTDWRPSHAAGTHRLYSNPSIGLFGYLAARSLGAPFDDLMEHVLFPKLGMKSTYIRVPGEQMEHYAMGYARDGQPTRVAPGMLDSETYGVKTTAADMLRFVEANLGAADLAEPLQRAVAATHIGYYTVAGMTQGLGWEMYADPSDLDQLLAGNSAKVIFEANPVTRLATPRPAENTVLINKTGSTNGFGAYVAFVPSRRIGIVILANKNYPIPARVRAAHQVLTSM